VYQETCMGKNLMRKAEKEKRIIIMCVVVVGGRGP
jgi:hypothetical protein